MLCAIRPHGLVTTIPIFVGISNQIINRQPISAVKWLTGCTAVFAVALLISDGYLSKFLDTKSSLIGIFMALGCAALVASFSVLVRPIITRHGALPVTALAMFIGGLGLWVVVGIAFGIWVNPLNFPNLPARQAWSLLVIARAAVGAFRRHQADDAAQGDVEPAGGNFRAARRPALASFAGPTVISAR